MAGEIATAWVTILPSFKGGAAALSRQMDPAAAAAGKTAGGKFSGGFGGAIAGIGATLAATGIISFFSGAVGAASDLNETVSKSKVIFGEQFGAIDAWSDKAATSLGLPKQAALEAAAGFGDMFAQLGFADDAAADMSTSTVQLAADLGSFNNLPTADVAQRISAAFRGEYDSLQLLIPNINAARVEQEALAMTGKKTAKELTAAEKAAAVLAIVHGDGAAAAGDFARTSDQLANRQKILSARFTDIKTKIGSALVPAMNALVGAGLVVIDFFTENARVIGVVAGIITALFLPLLIKMGIEATISAAKVVAGWVAQSAAAAAASAAHAVAVAQQVAAWAVLGAKALLHAAKVAAAWLIAMGPIALVIAAVVGLVALIILNFDKIKQWIGDAWDWVREKTVSVWDAVVTWIKELPGKILSALTGMWDFITTEIGQMKDAVIQIGVNIINWFIGLPGRLLDVLSSLGSQMYGVGKRIVQALWDGLKAVWDQLVAWFEGALDWLTGLWPFSPAKHGPLRDKPPSKWGENIGSLLADGLKSKQAAVRAAAESLARAAQIDAFVPGVAMGPNGSAGRMTGPKWRPDGRGTDGASIPLYVTTETHYHNPIMKEAPVDEISAGFDIARSGVLDSMRRVVVEASR